MATELKISDGLAYELAAEIAQATGKSLTEVVVDSLQREKNQLLSQRKIDHGAARAIVERVKRRTPGRSNITAKEIAGYDEKGLLLKW